jgi:hypothetical protein
MIAKHIPRQPGNDNFRALALYAADARIGREKGEKTLMRWHAGCMAETYLDAMMEVEATQAMNTRTKKEKTYHLMVSFRPGDEAKLTPEIFGDIEKEFAKALDFSAHQRLCGVHKNTNNIHMHIAYNMINTVKFTRYEPFRDFPKLHEACRRLEQKYGLEIDNGIDNSRAKNDTKKHAKAETIEAQTGQQTFYNYVAARKKTILDLMTETASSWKEIHEIFLKFGMEIRPKGSGLVIKDRFGKYAIKASYIDRSLSKNQMEKVFGPYQELTKEQLLAGVKSETKFTAAPLHQHEKTAELFAQFQAEMERKKAALDAVKEAENQAYNSNKKMWDAQRKRAEKYAMLTRHRRELLQEIKAKEEAEIVTHRIKFAEKRAEIRKEIPFTSWTKFLQHQAEIGNETALEILRSKKLKPELSVASSNEKYIADLEATKLSKERQAAVMSRLGINQKHKRALVSIIKMRELIAKETGLKNEDIKHNISVNGTVIFTLKTGGTIRDTGKEIYFSSHDSQAGILGEKYARMRWGRNVLFEGNSFRFVKPIAQQKDKPQGLSR